MIVFSTQFDFVFNIQFQKYDISPNAFNSNVTQFYLYITMISAGVFVHATQMLMYSIPID